MPPWLLPERSDQILRYHLNGDPAPFSASAEYISGNRLIADPASEDGKFDTNPDIAVDSSASPNHGKLFVTSAPNVDIFNPTGLHAGAILQPIETTIPNVLNGVEVGPDGSIYVTSDLPGPGRVSKYNTALQEVKRAYPDPTRSTATPGSRSTTTGPSGSTPGNSAVAETSSAIRAGSVHRRIEAEVRGPDAGTLLRGAIAVCDRTRYPDFSVNGIDVDLNNNNVLADRRQRDRNFSEGTGTKPCT